MKQSKRLRMWKWLTSKVNEKFWIENCVKSCQEVVVDRESGTVGPVSRRMQKVPL